MLIYQGIVDFRCHLPLLGLLATFGPPCLRVAFRQILLLASSFLITFSALTLTATCKYANWCSFLSRRPCAEGFVHYCPSPDIFTESTTRPISPVWASTGAPSPASSILSTSFWISSSIIARHRPVGSRVNPSSQQVDSFAASSLTLVAVFVAVVLGHMASSYLYPLNFPRIERGSPLSYPTSRNASSQAKILIACFVPSSTPNIPPIKSIAVVIGSGFLGWFLDPRGRPLFLVTPGH